MGVFWGIWGKLSVVLGVFESKIKFGMFCSGFAGLSTWSKSRYHDIHVENRFFRDWETLSIGNMLKRREMGLQVTKNVI